MLFFRKRLGALKVLQPKKIEQITLEELSIIETNREDKQIDV